MDVGRNGGEMIVPSIHRPTDEPLAWAVRWHRDRNHLKENFQASVSLATTHDALDWMNLLRWCRQSMAIQVDSELFVIDDELDVTMYKLDLIDPQGIYFLGIDWMRMIRPHSFRTGRKEHQPKLEATLDIMMLGNGIKLALNTCQDVFSAMRKKLTSSRSLYNPKNHPAILSSWTICSIVVYCFVLDSNMDVDGGFTMEI